MKPFYHHQAFIVFAFVVAILAPTLSVIVLGILGPEPYLLDRESLGIYENKARLRQQAQVETKLFPSPPEARAAVKAYARSVDAHGRVQTLDEHRFTRNDNGNYVLLGAVGEAIVSVEGRDREHVDAVFADLPFIVDNPQKNLLWLLINQHAEMLFAGLGLYMLFLLLAFSRWHSAANTVPAMTGRPPGPETVLRHELLALNQLDIPFELTEDDNGRIIARWRIGDDKWQALLSRGQQRVSCTLVLSLDEKSRTARAVQTTHMVRRSAGLAGFFTSLGWTRSVGFAYESAAGYGVLQTDQGWRPAATYRYRFTPKEMSQPVADVILQNGWRFKPVYTFFRPLGG